MAAAAEQVVVGGAGRLMLAALLYLVALALAALGLRLGWGIGWMAWVPAAVLLLPAAALAGRTVVRCAGAGIEREQGWLFRRVLVLALDGGELEILPAGGAWVVILHRGRSSQVLAAWIGRGTASRIAALCDRAHPDGAMPRREPQRPAGDR